MAAKLGTNIDAVISHTGAHRWPRYRIQAAIGTLIVKAMPSSISSGASVRQADASMPTTLSPAASGIPRANMPRNIAASISA
jgi:hypothetical protein